MRAPRSPWNALGGRGRRWAEWCSARAASDDENDLEEEFIYVKAPFALPKGATTSPACVTLDQQILLTLLRRTKPKLTSGGGGRRVGHAAPRHRPGVVSRRLSQCYPAGDTPPRSPKVLSLEFANRSSSSSGVSSAQSLAPRQAFSPLREAWDEPPASLRQEEKAPGRSPSAFCSAASRFQWP